MKYWRYGWSVVRHKWFVFLACWKMGIPLAGITHDLSKFLPDEFGPYAEYFYGGYPRDQKPPAVQEAFDRAWKKHQQRNRHHWQHWLVAPREFDLAECWRHVRRGGAPIVRNATYGKSSEAEFLWETSILAEDDGDIRCLACGRTFTVQEIQVQGIEMPERYWREMVADWMGAGRSFGKPDTATWYRKNREKIQLAPATRVNVEMALNIPLAEMKLRMA